MSKNNVFSNMPKFYLYSYLFHSLYVFSISLLHKVFNVNTLMFSFIHGDFLASSKIYIYWSICQYQWACWSYFFNYMIFWWRTFYYNAAMMCIQAEKYISYANKTINKTSVIEKQKNHHLLLMIAASRRC